jgi:hypothetical protein
VGVKGSVRCKGLTLKRILFEDRRYWELRVENLQRRLVVWVVSEPAFVRSLVLALTLACVCSGAPAPMQLVATAQIVRLVASEGPPNDVSTVFLSDDMVALLVRSGRPRAGASQIVVLRLAEGEFQLVARLSKTNEGEEFVFGRGKSAYRCGQIS